MKTYKLNAPANTFRKAIVVIAVGIMTVGVAKANDLPTNNSNKEKAEISNLKSENDELSFTVNYANVDGEKFQILIKDAEGYSIFSSVYSDKSFNKAFRVPAENGKVVVVLRTAKLKAEQTFEIVTEAKIVQEVSVKKLQ